MRAEDLRRLGGLKWTYYDEDVLAAWVAEMDFGLAPAVSDALHDAVDRGLTGYPYPDAEDALADAAVDFWRDAFEWEVAPESVFSAPDVIEGIRRCIVHLTRPESPVVLHTPVYFPFFPMVEKAGREMIEVVSRRDRAGRFSLDLDGIEQGLRSGAGSVILCNPWNPTGRVLSRSEIEELTTLAARYDARVIADEVHAPIVYGEHRHTPAATVDAARVITVTAATKAWNLPGLKSAQVVLTDPADREIWSDYFTTGFVGVGTFGILASRAAYADGRDWFREILDRLETNRSLLNEIVTRHAPKALHFPPEGTFLAWIDLSPYGIEDPASFLEDRARVAVIGGSSFRGDTPGHIRVNFATDPEILVEIFTRIGRALEGR